jgi:glycosyltransferase involved in cell wall biosynthesis
MKKIKLGFLTSHNYLDRNAFSGTIFYMYHALKLMESENFEVVGLGNPYYPSRVRSLIKKFQKNMAIININSVIDDQEKETRKFALLLEKQIQDQSCNLIFAPVASDLISSLQTQLPIIYLSDATYKLLVNNYPTNLSKEQINRKEQNEFISIQKSTKIIYSSHWAAQSAIKDYRADSSKIKIIPFGANIDVEQEPTLTQIKSSHLITDTCKLLFMGKGKDWERKRGNLALEILEELNKKSFQSQLTILGGIPPEIEVPPNVNVIRFLNKNKKKDRDIFNQILLNANFLIFPSRADCSPIVLCEASAYGLPIISTNVGGIPDIVKEGKNGYMVSPDASGTAYANMIQKVYSNSDHYQQLVMNTRKEYEMRLNWKKWAEQLYSVIIETT